LERRFLFRFGTGLGTRDRFGPVWNENRFGVSFAEFLADFIFEAASLLFDCMLRLQPIAHLPQFVERALPSGIPRRVTSHALR
jgi:hypothetical protein